METFPIVKRKDETRYGEYRTKRVILEIYDAMQRDGDGYAVWRDGGAVGGGVRGAGRRREGMTGLLRHGGDDMVDIGEEYGNNAG